MLDPLIDLDPCSRCELVEPGPAPCCRDWPIPIERHEAERFRDELVPTAAGPRFAGELRRLPGGECVFLGASGCSIYPERPAACRAFAAGRCHVNARAAGVGIVSRTPAAVTRLASPTILLRDRRLARGPARRPTRAVVSDVEHAMTDAVEAAVDAGAAHGHTDAASSRPPVLGLEAPRMTALERDLDEDGRDRDHEDEDRERGQRPEHGEPIGAGEVEHELAHFRAAAGGAIDTSENPATVTNAASPVIP